MADGDVAWHDGARRDRIDDGVEVEGREVGILGPHVDHLRVRMPRQLDATWQRVVEIRKGDPVLGADRGTEDDPIDGVELPKVLVVGIDILVEWLEPWASGDGNVERLCRQEAVEVKHVEVVLVDDVAQQRVTESVERRHLRQGKIPSLVTRTFHVWLVQQRLMIVKPVDDRTIF